MSCKDDSKILRLRGLVQRAFNNLVLAETGNCSSKLVLVEAVLTRVENTFDSIINSINNGEYHLSTIVSDDFLRMYFSCLERTNLDPEGILKREVTKSLEFFKKYFGQENLDNDLYSKFEDLYKRLSSD